MLGRFLFRVRLGELLARDHSLAQEDFAEPIGSGWCGRHDLAV
jgi:hypothetical protein